MPDLFERVLLLKHSQIFGEIPTDDLRFVADALEEERFFAGDRVFNRGEQGDYMYFIVSGRVGIALENGTGDDYVAQLASSDSFGEMNLIDDLPRSASAIVLEDSVLLKLGKQRLRSLLMTYPELGMGMLKSLSLKLRDTTRKVYEAENTARG